MTNQINKKKIAVIGGGAAGAFAAIAAAEAGADVTVFERNGEKQLCRKLGITGKGRCNVTNDCDRDTFLSNVPCNSNFLFAAFAAFPPSAVMGWFEDAGVPLKVERGNRVFPVSDQAGDIVGALKKAVRRNGIRVKNEFVSSIEKLDSGFSVNGDSELYDRVILATGGMSYQVTGSDGSGYDLAESLGHTIVEPKGGLVPLTCAGTLCRELQGLSLKNVSLTVRKKEGGKVVFEDFGEMLFTHFGLSGPMVLTASSAVPDIDMGGYVAEIDMKPALDEKQLDARLIREFEADKNKNFSNVVQTLVPSKMAGPFVVMTGIPSVTKANSLTREDRKKIISVLKCIRIEITGTRPVNEAIITKGGVSCKEIKPGSMESKLVPGLFFAGEIIDADAFTGGFNLQIAWSTGHMSGVCAAKDATDKKEKKSGKKAESADSAEITEEIK